MKSIISAIFLLIIGIFAVIFVINHPLFEAITRPLAVSPCDYSIKYKIGDIDSRFGLTQNEVNSNINDAITIWRNAEGKVLFEQGTKNALEINLVYDARQALNSQIDTLKNKINEEKNTLDPQIQAFNAKSDDFKSRLGALNGEIAYWNSHGGASPEEYQKISAERDLLTREADELNAMAKNLNGSANTFNTQVGVLNQTVDTFNQSLKLKPEEGLYQPAQNKIDIYFNISHTELVHTLAHELGHAIGIDHNSNPNSIMYPYTTTVTSPSPDDLTALKKVCQPQFFMEIAAQKLAEYLQPILNKNAQQ